MGVQVSHVVFTPKYRKKVRYKLICRDLKAVFHGLAKQKECVIEAGELMPDHVHMVLAIPPKHSVASILGFLKGKSLIRITRNIANKQKNFVGHQFWARGYLVSRVGVDEEMVKTYIQKLARDDNPMDDPFDR